MAAAAVVVGCDDKVMFSDIVCSESLFEIVEKFKAETEPLLAFV